MLIECASFDTTRFPAMEVEALKRAERFCVDPIDLLLACESILKAGLGDIVQVAPIAETEAMCRCGQGGFKCCEDT